MITQDRLKVLFSYREDGNLIWLKTMNNFIKEGDVAGHVNKTGYVNVGVDYKSYLLHRLIYLYHHGWLPPLVDHIDTDHLNNRINNLREASRSLNASNSNKSRGPTPFRGVYLLPSGRYSAVTCYEHKQKHIGVFDKPEEAYSAYLTTREELRSALQLLR